MKYPVTITCKNEELILTVKKKDFAKILVDIYVQLSEKSRFFAYKPMTNHILDSQTPSLTFAKDFIYELTEIAEALLKKADKTKDNVEKINAFAFFEACKKLYMSINGKKYSSANIFPPNTDEYKVESLAYSELNRTYEALQNKLHMRSLPLDQLRNRGCSFRPLSLLPPSAEEAREEEEFATGQITLGNHWEFMKTVEGMPPDPIGVSSTSSSQSSQSVASKVKKFFSRDSSADSSTARTINTSTFITPIVIPAIMNQLPEAKEDTADVGEEDSCESALSCSQ